MLTEEEIRGNNDTLKRLEELPDLLTAMKKAAEGDKSYIKDYFYYWNSVIKHCYLGKCRKYVVRQRKMYDDSLNFFLEEIKRTYYESDIEFDTYNREGVKCQEQVFDESGQEIEELFEYYVTERFFRKKKKFDFNYYTDREQQLNALRKYIRKGFLQYLKYEYKRRKRINRFRLSTIYFDDITVAEFEDGNEITFMDVVTNSTTDQYLHIERSKEKETRELDRLAYINVYRKEPTKEELAEYIKILDEREQEEISGFVRQIETWGSTKRYYRDAVAEYIYTNYHKIFTKKQLIKFDQVIQYLQDHPDYILYKVDRNGKISINQTKLGKIWFPEQYRKDKGSTEGNVSKQLERMKKRLQKKLKSMSKNDILFS